MSRGVSPRGGEERSLEVASECDRMEICKIWKQIMISVLAVYENGVLKPTEPLDLQEGQSVQLSVYPHPPLEPLPSPTPEEEDYARRVKAAKSLEELHAVMLTAPPLPEGYDLSEALNANRLAIGERLLFSELSPEDEQ